MGSFALLLALAFTLALAFLKDWKRPVGIVLIVMTVVSAFFYYYMTKIDEEAKIVPKARTIENIRILYSGDKKTLLYDSEFQEMLKKQYGIVIDSVKAGAAESDMLKGIDGIWFSRESEKREFDRRHPDMKYQAKNIFHTPMVLYSWAEVTKTLIRQGIVEKKQELYALLNFKKLQDMQGKTWESIGLSGGYEKIRIVSDDTEKDNPVSLFDRYIKQGQLTYPLISGCENAIIELYQTQPGYREKLKDTRVLIPEPITLNLHPFIALTPKGKDLLVTLEKPDVQKFISTKYGLRSGAGEISAEVAKELGLPQRISVSQP
ncbi:MAG: hypothetical protein BWK80_26240 [Desulfobacteraceae bacterium IS3]|nr:MAG: hypothetical protein BWK80_26240 [Desulfobacteraceae bacterium IS3]HAO22829.1 hypothetical protein [Desulfobacteraceae bacterium]